MKTDIEKALAKLKEARRNLDVACAQVGGHDSESFVINARTELDQAMAILKKIAAAE